MRGLPIYLCSALLFFSCGKKHSVHAPSIPVSAMKVKEQTIPADFTFVGVAESSHIVELRARVEGYLEDISYTEGSMVNEGKLMFTLDQRPFIDVVNEKNGDLAREKALLWNTQQQKNRMVPLYKQNAVSQRDYDNAIANELSAEANVKVAEAALEKAKVNLSYTEITAPVKGMASRAIFREGALIAPGRDSSLLTNIFVIDPIWVNFAVSEWDILDARTEQKEGRLQMPSKDAFDIEVVLADGTTMPADGKIDFLDPALQQSTSTMLVRSVLPNPKGWLKPGQFVQVVVKGAHYPNALMVPQSAVMMSQKGTMVFVIDKNGIAEARPVTTGTWYKNFWIITKGLKDGDVVVAQGVNRVQQGSKVVIQSWMHE